MIRTLLARLRLLSLLAGFVALLAAGLGVLPLAADAWDWVRAADDPVALAERGLAEELDADAVAHGVETALDGDVDLAASFLVLAEARGIDVPPALRARVAAAADAEAWAAGGDFLRGVVFGNTESVSGLAGAVAGDLVGIGDVRDFTREGWRLATGEPADEIVLALSAAGLAVTGATWGSFGAAAPARAGLTVLKSARTAGRLSPMLARSLGRLAAGAIDGAALRRSAAALGRFDLAGARGAAKAVLRPSHVEPLAGMGRDTARLMTKAGYRATDDVLALATSPADLRRAAVLSDHHAGATRAVVKLLGRGALVLTRAAAELAGWLLAGLAWAWSLAAWCAAAGRALGRAARRTKVGTTGPYRSMQLARAG